MSALPSAAVLSEWDHSLFHRIQQLLTSFVAQPKTSTLRRLLTLLDEAKPWLLGLTHLPGPSAGDKAEVEKTETTTPSGSSAKIAGDALNAVDSIANTLAISQKLAATLYLQSEEQRPRYPSRATTEIAIFVYQEWIGQMLDALRALLQATVQAEALDTTGEELRIWVEDLLRSPTALAKGEGSLVDQILGQIDALQSKIDALLQSRTGDYELASFVVGAHRSSQCKMAGILAIIAESGGMGRGHIVKVLKWLQKARKADGLVTVLLCVFLASCKPLDTLDPTDQRFEGLEIAARDRRYLSIAANLVVREPWTIPGLGEVVKLAWFTFYLSALRHDGAAAHIGIDQSQAEQFVLEAITGDAFVFSRTLIVMLRQERALDAVDQVEDGLWRIAHLSDPLNDEFIYSQSRDLVNALATKKHFLRNLRNKEEDLAVRRSTSSAPQHYQDFLTLVTVIYTSLPPDSAQDLWSDPTFSSVILDIRSGLPRRSFLDMLTAISSGPKCAAVCFEKIKETRFPWTALFQFYAYYADIMPHQFEPIKSNRPASLEPMPIEEAEICQAWTRLLTTVVKYSKVAQSTLLQAKPPPLQVLFDLLNCDIPLPLKSAILDAITAFCSYREDEVYARAVEYYERISFTDPTLEIGPETKVPPPIGWVAKMEYTEAEAQSYPLLRSYLEFLTELLGAKNRANLLRRGVQYVFDRALLVQRRFATEGERWQTLDCILAFVEKAVMIFDMGELLVSDNRSLSTIATSLAKEPGFLVILRLLSEPEALNAIADIIDHPSPSPSVLTRALRIYHRLLDVQLVFSDVLLTALANAGSLRRPIGLQSVEHHLLKHLSNITNIALFVGYADLNISLLAINIISALSHSPVFNRSDVFRGEYSTGVNRLAGIMDASDDSIRINLGFSEKLQAEGEELSTAEIKKLERAVLRENTDDLSIVARNAILDLLLEGAGQSDPNLSHFILGYDFRAPDNGLLASSHMQSLHVVLQQIDDERFFDSHPVLAAKSAQLLYRLFTNATIGQSTISFASSTSQFPIRQLATLPTSPPEGRSGTLLSRGQPSGSASGEDVVAFFDYQRWIISCCAALAFSADGEGPGISELALLLFEGFEDRPPALLDLLNYLDLQWTPDLAADRTLEFFANFDFDAYKRPNVDWWDVDSLGRALRVQRDQLQKQGKIPVASVENVNGEIGYIIARLAAKNQQTDVALAHGELILAWNATLKVALSLLHKHVSEDVQETILFDLLDALLSHFGNDMAPGVIDVLCESVLVTTTAMVADLLDVEESNLPLERLASILHGMLEALGRAGTTENARGNLYASISQFLRLSNAGDVPDDVSIASTSTPAPALHRAILAVLSSRKERLLPILCRDAMDDRDVWKTECFALLGAVVALCRNDRERESLVPIIKNGFLGLFVKGIKDQEISLQDCLSTEPGEQPYDFADLENLHAFWVFEAKLAFLMSWAGTRRGAEELLDAGIFETLSMCSFLAVQPIGMIASEASESVKRQHVVFTTTLQLLSRVLYNLSGGARSGAGHAISFLNAHRKTILMQLRELHQLDSADGIDESRLLISIFAMVVHKVPSEDLRTSAGFGAFHLAVLAIAAHTLNPEELQDRYSPETYQSILGLNQVILGYLIATTAGLKSRSGFPALTLNAQRVTPGAQFYASAPSLQLTVDYLGQIIEDLQQLSHDYESALEKLRNGQLDVIKSVEQSADDLIAPFTAKHGLLSTILDSLLLLIWRHLLFYANETLQGEGTVRPDNLSLSLGSFGASQVGASQSAVNAARSLDRVAGLLRGNLERLEDMSLHPDLQRASQGNDAYHGMLSRRLTELTAVLIQ